MNQALRVRLLVALVLAVGACGGGVFAGKETQIRKKSESKTNKEWKRLPPAAQRGVLSHSRAGSGFFLAVVALRRMCAPR